MHVSCCIYCIPIKSYIHRIQLQSNQTNPPNLFGLFTRITSASRNGYKKKQAQAFMALNRPIGISIQWFPGVSLVLHLYCPFSVHHILLPSPQNAIELVSVGIRSGMKPGREKNRCRCCKYWLCARWNKVKT